jgi:hypothetical protein
MATCFSYPRYGGLAQNYPLTQEDKLYDATLEELDRLEREIAGKRLSLFTAAEFMWFSRNATRIVVGPKQSQLEATMIEYIALLTTLEERGA